MPRRHYSEKRVNKPGGIRDPMREAAQPLGRSTAPILRDRSLTPDGAEQPTTVRSYVRPAKNINAFSNREPRGEKKVPNTCTRSMANSKIPKKTGVTGPLPKSHTMSNCTVSAGKVNSRNWNQNILIAQTPRSSGITKKTPTIGGYSGRPENVPECSRQRTPVASQRSVQNIGPLPKSPANINYTASAGKFNQPSRDRNQSIFVAQTPRSSRVTDKKTSTTGGYNGRPENIPECSRTKSPVKDSQRSVQNVSSKQKDSESKESALKPSKSVPTFVGKGPKSSLLECSGSSGNQPRVVVGNGIHKHRKDENDTAKSFQKRQLTEEETAAAEERRRLSSVMKADDFSIETSNKCLSQVLVRINKLKLPYRPMPRCRSKKVRSRIEKAVCDRMLAPYLHSKKPAVPSSSTTEATDGIQEESAPQDVVKEKSATNSVSKELSPLKIAGKEQSAPAIRQEQPMLLENPSLVEENVPEPPQEMNFMEQDELLPLPVPPLPPVPVQEPLPVPPFPVLEAPHQPSEEAVVAEDVPLFSPEPIVQQKKKCLITNEALRMLKSLFSAEENIGRPRHVNLVMLPLSSKENRPHSIKGPIAEKRAAVDPQKKARIFLPCPPHKTLRECLINKDPATNSVDVAEECMMPDGRRCVAVQTEVINDVILKRVKEEPSE